MPKIYSTFRLKTKPSLLPSRIVFFENGPGRAYSREKNKTTKINLAVASEKDKGLQLTAADIIKNDYSEDIQEYLYKLDKKTQLDIRLPSKWFQPDTAKGETIQQKVDGIYNKIFLNKNGPLQAQLAAFNQKYHSGKPPVSAEVMVFGSPAKDAPERTLRLKEVRNRIENLRNLKEIGVEEINTNKIVKNVSEGTGNILNSLKENMGESKWVEAGIQIASLALLFSAAKTLLFKPKDKTWGSALWSVVLKAAIGIGLLIPSATKGKSDVLDWAKLTSYADKVGDRGLGTLMKNMDMRTRTEAEAVNAIAKIDIGDLHQAYEEARSDGKSEIDPRKLIQAGKLPKKTIVNNKEFFKITEDLLERYGAKYFALINKRPPKDPQEIQDGIALFVHFHKKTKNHKKSFRNVIAYEEKDYKAWQEGKAPRNEGKLVILGGIATEIGMSILHPTEAPERLGEAFLKWLDIFEIGHEWFSTHVSDPVKNTIKNTWKNNKPKAKKMMENIREFKKTEWEKLEKEGIKVYVTGVGEKSVDIIMMIGGATIGGVYKVGEGIVTTTLDIVGHTYDNIQTYIEKEGTLGNKVIISQWIPYSYDPEKKEWKRASVAEVKTALKEITIDGVSYVYNASTEKISNGAEWLSVYLEKGLPKQWKEIQPKLTGFKNTVVEDYELFKAFTKSVIFENFQVKSDSSDKLKKAGKSGIETRKEIIDFFTNDDRLLQVFYTAASTATTESLEAFKNGTMSLKDFLTTYAKEAKEKEQNIKDFEGIINNPAEEKEYFSNGGNLEGLEPKTRAWMFDKLSSWNLDVDKNSLKYDSNGKFIEYENITLESIGTAGSFPLFGNKKCKLRINFAPDGQLGNKTRFELTPKDLPTLQLNPKDLASPKAIKIKVEDVETVQTRQRKLKEMQEKLDDTGSGSFTLAGEEFKRIDEHGGLGANFDWLTDEGSYDYTYTDKHGNNFKVSIPVPTELSFVFSATEIASSKTTTLKTLKDKFTKTLNQKDLEANSALTQKEEKELKNKEKIQQRSKSVARIRKRLGDQGGGSFSLEKKILPGKGDLYTFKKIDANGGVTNWLADDAQYAYRYEDQNGAEYFIKISADPAKGIIFEAPGEDPMPSDSAKEIKKAAKEQIIGKVQNKEVDLLKDLEIENPGDLKRGDKGLLVLKNSRMQKGFGFGPNGDGVKLEGYIFKNQSGEIINFPSPGKEIKIGDIMNPLSYRIGKNVPIGTYTAELTFRMNGLRKTTKLNLQIVN